MDRKSREPTSGAAEAEPEGATSEQRRETDAQVEMARLAEILRSSSDPIIGKDLDGVITSWNGGAERLYGYTAEEAVGRHINLIVPPGLESEVEGFMVSLQRGERIEQVETRRVTKGGREVEVSVTISPIRDARGRIVGASSIARNIGELRRARRELEAREQRIRLLLDSTAEAIYGIDTDGLCTFANPACARLLGYSDPEELAGRDMHAAIHHSHADGSPYPIERCPIYNAFRKGEKVHVDTEVLWRRDGSCFPAEYWSHPIQEDGEIVGAVVTFLDITIREETAAELRREARRRDEFLAMLSHELRNPLAAIVSATRVLALAAPRDAEQMNRARGIIERQSEHMARLLDDLLDVGRIVSGRIELRFEPTDLCEAMRRAVETIGPMFDERAIELRPTWPDDPIIVRGDLARLQQVAVNLLTNAARYSSEGTTVTLEARREGDCAVIVVRDEGSGIEPKLLPRIFDLFVQGERELHRAEGGLGVGLTLVRDLVDHHGGTVEARSDGVDLGSEFTVRLPLSTEQLSTSESDGSPAGAGDDAKHVEPCRSLRIVLVEDREDERVALKLLLEMSGHRVVEAVDGHRGLEQITSERPDLALVDIGLPGLNGHEVARAVRSNAELTDVSLVALSGYGAESDVNESRSAGFDLHLTKPVDLAELDRLLDTLDR